MGLSLVCLGLISLSISVISLCERQLPRPVPLWNVREYNTCSRGVDTCTTGAVYSNPNRIPGTTRDARRPSRYY